MQLAALAQRVGRSPHLLFALLGAALVALHAPMATAQEGEGEAPPEIGTPPIPPTLNFTMKDIDGKEVRLSKYQGKVILMVNVASRCGYTPQYKGLQLLHEKHHEKGLVILAFPANNFRNQEPGSNEEIKDFCTTNYDVKFQLFEKVSVKGEDICPLYKLLTNKEKTPASEGEINWNFEKFLLDHNGTVVKHFRSKATPEQIEPEIVKLLGAMPESAGRIEAPQLADAAPRDLPGLHNVVAYHEGYWSGSAPDGATGFETLAALGVKTIISVDGAAPDVESARARGLRYIHLPIGYNGVSEERQVELARATRDALAQGPVYIHCHHGRHRSAGAAGAVAVSLGWLTPDRAVERMKVSGTAPNYTGLYASVAHSAPLDPAVIEAVNADFPEVSRPVGFVKGMVEVELVSDHLKAIEKAGWTTPPDHPDLVPAAEAGRMVDLLRILAEGRRARDESAEFRAILVESINIAQQIEDFLVAATASRAQLTEQFQRLTAACNACHAQYRD